MRILVPFTELNPATKQVLSPLGAYFVHMADEYHYNSLLKAQWEQGETFFIVEHDIVPWPGALDELNACPCEWGTYSYQPSLGVSHMLGCCKLTDRLIAKLPGLWDTPRHWAELDQHLFFAAREKGIEPHLHRPPVTHLK